MEIEQREGPDGETVIALDGELDLGTADPLRESLFAVIDGGDQKLAVDMTKCSFIDSTGLRILVEAARRLGHDGERLHLIGLSEQPRKVFELTMGGRFEMFRLSDGG
jgi:anti-anti-sigma factor